MVWLIWKFWFNLGMLTSLNPEEFVAHASNVNCLKIGRKTSRVLVTGGEDHKVNLWAIGKPSARLVGYFLFAAPDSLISLQLYLVT